MPTIRKRYIPRRPPVEMELTYELRKQLEFGRPMFNDTIPADDITLRELWDEFGDEVTANYIKRWPGRRPLYHWLTQGMEPPADQTAYLESIGELTQNELNLLSKGVYNGRPVN